MLQIWGFLGEFYPEATGDWEKDKVVPPSVEPDILSKQQKANIKEWLKTLKASFDPAQQSDESETH